MPGAQKPAALAAMFNAALLEEDVPRCLQLLKMLAQSSERIRQLPAVESQPEEQPDLSAASSPAGSDHRARTKSDGMPQHVYHISDSLFSHRFSLPQSLKKCPVLR